MKKAISQLIRSTKLGLLFLDYYPINVEFYDSKKRIVPRSVYRLFKLWNRSVWLESDAVYSTYNGGDVIDVGAFHGFYSLLLAPKARKNDKFISIEPDSQAIPTLLRNISTVSQLFSKVKFFTFPFAVGNNKPIKVSYPMGKNGHPQYLSDNDTQELTKDKAYSTDEICKLFNIKPSFVKIDVEGAEYEVLSGMKNTLAESKPTIMLELHPEWQPPGCSVEMITSFLQSYGYTSQELTRDRVSIRSLWKHSEEHETSFSSHK